MNAFKLRLARLIATLGGAGYLRPAPGSWGSAVALLCAYPAYLGTGFWGFVVLTCAACPIGYWATQIVEARDGAHDPSYIVIDELAGQWIALWPVAWGAQMTGLDPIKLWPGILAAFLLFRLFDILKPGPIGWADRKGGTLGVMLDDILAGVAAAFVALLLAGLAHGVFGL